MKLNGNSLDEVLMKETLSDEDIVFLLGLTEPEDCKKLQEAAYKKTTELMGNKVYYRGLIEVSNVCTVDCRYRAHDILEPRPLPTASHTGGDFLHFNSQPNIHPIAAAPPLYIYPPRRF